MPNPVAGGSSLRCAPALVAQSLRLCDLACPRGQMTLALSQQVAPGSAPALITLPVAGKGLGEKSSMCQASVAQGQELGRLQKLN